MARWAYHYPEEFERYLGGLWWKGVAFFPERETARERAREVREFFGARCRVVTIPKSREYNERYLVLLLARSTHPVEQRAMAAARPWLRERALEDERKWRPEQGG